jgi:hypothetical protein
VADWVTISSLATAGGTLTLAMTTYLSVRSANQAARTAERTLLAELRPLVIQSSLDDADQRIGFMDNVGLTVPGGTTGVEIIERRIYLVFSLRNVGPGIAVLHGGYAYPERMSARIEHAPIGDFRLLTRDIYIPSGKIGFWQIAFREDDDPVRESLLGAIDTGWFSVDILYGDYEGGQRVITRFGVARDDDGVWRHSAVRHWQIDRSDPR